MGLPIAQHLLDLGDHLILVQGLELAVQANHGDQRAAVSLEQGRIDPRTAPARPGKSLQRQHPQAGEIATALAQRRLVGLGPLALPDIQLLIESRSRGLFAAPQKQHGEGQREPEKNSHEALTTHQRPADYRHSGRSENGAEEI